MVAPRALAALLALLACLGQASGGKQHFTLRVESRDADWGRPGLRRALMRNTTMPLHGAVKKFGYFYANLYLGTPARKFAVIVDTGSTMTYIPCASCGGSCGPNHVDPAFDYAASSTASLVGCADSDARCRCGSPRCGCTAAGRCAYTRSYAEQSSSSGILLQDVLSLHDGDRGTPVIFGCETGESGEIFNQAADGLFGLGTSDASLINQLAGAGVIDDVFSLCFGSVAGEGALSLGDAPVPPSVNLSYTPLIHHPAHPFYYNVRLLGISVGSDRLDVEEDEYEVGYGTVLDSGTTFSYLPSPAFRVFAAAVHAAALAAGLKATPGPDPEYSDRCYSGAPSDFTDEAAMAAVFPTVTLSFREGLELTLSPLSYLFVHTFGTGKYCLGVFDNGGAGTLLGGITFRNVLIRYDRQNGRVGMGAADCRAIGLSLRPPCFAFDGSVQLSAAAEGDCRETPPARAQEREEGAWAPAPGPSQPAAGGPAGAVWPPPPGQPAKLPGSLGSIAVGLGVAVASVLALSFAVALLQPATRDWLRGLSSSSQYRTFTDDSDLPDPEMLPLSSVPGQGSGAGGGKGAAVALTQLGGGGGGGLQPPVQRIPSGSQTK